MGITPKPLFFVSLVYEGMAGKCRLASRCIALRKCARAGAFAGMPAGQPPRHNHPTKKQAPRGRPLSTNYLQINLSISSSVTRGMSSPGIREELDRL